MNMEFIVLSQRMWVYILPREDNFSLPYSMLLEGNAF